LLFAWLLFALSAVAQSPECFFVHFDKSFYASGETIWFKAYRIGTANEVNSRVLHIDLVSHQNKLIASQKLLIENGSGYGSITLPINSEEGLYRFRAYTRYDLNFNPPLIYNASIPIYSPEYSENPDADNTSPGNSNPVGFSGISVAADNKIYEPRDSLTISFQVEGITDIDKANFSVSVVPSEIVSLNFEFYRNLQCPDLSPGPGSLMLPEKHLFVEGKLQDPVTGKNINSRLLSVYVNESSQLIRASSSEGKIKVAVPDYWGAGVFQILNLDPYNNSGLKLIEEPKGPGDP
jgi:hypothetical protein